MRIRKSETPQGVELLHDPVLNKGTAFTEAERDALGLRGLLPPNVQTQEQQVSRVMEAFRKQAGPLERYIYMMGLEDRNETLFYRAVLENLDEIMPVIYTPTVGRACQEYGHIFRRPRGVFVSADDRGRVRDLLRNWPNGDVRVIVVTDGERILGLGDLGANGMGIPVGKLALYTACAGVHPRHCLPVTLDVGTDRPSLIADPLYLGLHRPRIRGAAYDDLVEEFVQAVQDVFPRALIQFEDFANRNAFRLLERYRERICTFNDDIQGTAAVVLSGLGSALRITGGKLHDQTILFLGAGSAALGCAELISAAVAGCGVDRDRARRCCWLFDSHGLVVRDRTGLTPQKQRFAHDGPGETDFVGAVRRLRPTAIVGASGHAGTFTREIVETMARLHERPVVFSLSNPTSNAECTAEEAYTWSAGRAVFASGSPFPPFELDGRRFVPGQGNNAYVFPGVGLGVVCSGSVRVTDEMFAAAAATLAEQVSDEDIDRGSIFPPLALIRTVSERIATAVAEIAYARKLAREPRPADLPASIRARMYRPEYPRYA